MSVFLSFQPPSVNATGPCISLEWDSTGSTLAILHSSPSNEILLYDFNNKVCEHIDFGLKDPSFMRWNTTGTQLSIGTGRGELLLYDRYSSHCWFTSARHKKRITCGDWNTEQKFAFASDDRQITICSADGKTFGQVKVKSRPTNVKVRYAPNLINAFSYDCAYH